jgi:amidase
LSVVGFLTHAVADTALLVSVAAEAPALAAAPKAPPAGLRVASSLKPALPARVDPLMPRVVEETATRLRSLGHRVEEEDPAYPAVSPGTARYLAGIAQDAERVERPGRLQRRTRGFARLGRSIPSSVLDWARGNDTSVRMRPFFERHDVLLSPVMALPPVAAGQWEGLSAPRTLLGMIAAYPFTPYWNLTGQPALAVPAGTTDDGLPVGVQLVGRKGEEAMLLSLAAQLEQDMGWAGRRPPVS